MKKICLILAFLAVVACQVTVSQTPLSPAREPIKPDSVRVLLAGIDSPPDSVGCHRMSIFDANDTGFWTRADMGRITQALRREAAEIGANVVMLVEQDTDTGFFDDAMQGKAIAFYCEPAYLPPRDD